MSYYFEETDFDPDEYHYSKAYQQPEPTIEEICAGSGGHAYYTDYCWDERIIGMVGGCYCGERLYLPGGYVMPIYVLAFSARWALAERIWEYHKNEKGL